MQGGGDLRQKEKVKDGDRLRPEILEGGLIQYGVSKMPRYTVRHSIVTLIFLLFPVQGMREVYKFERIIELTREKRRDVGRGPCP